MPPSETDRRRWHLLAALWGVYAAFGLVAGSIAPVLTRVRDDLGVGETTLGLALGAWQFVFLFTSVPAGRLLDRMGLATGVGLGGVFIVLSAILRAGAQGSVSLWLAIALFGVGGPFVSIGAAQLAAGRFGDTERSTAVGIYSTAAPVGSMVALLTAENVFVPLVGSWRGVQLVFGGLAAAALVVWLAVSRPRPADPPVTAVPPAPAFSLLGDRAVRWVMVFTVGAFFVGHALGNWLPTVLIETGWTRSSATTLVGVSVGVGLVGSLTIPRRVRPGSAGLVLGTLFVISAGVVATLAIDRDAVQLSSVLVLGVLRVTLVPVTLLMLMSRPAVSTAKMGAAGGLFFTAGEIGGVLGPLSFGAVRDLTGGFGPGLIAMSVLMAGVGILAWLEHRRGAHRPL